MDSCLPDWNAEVGVEFPLPTQKKTLGLESDLVELVWQNGEVVLNSQTNRKRTDQVHKHGQSTTLPNNSIQDFETISWTDCPIDESFDKEFYENLLSEIPSSCSPLDPNKPLGKFDTEKIVKFDSLDANHVSLPLASPVFDQELESVAKNDYFQSPAKKQASSHCASNQVVKDVDMSWGSSCGIGSKTMSFGVKEKYCRNVSPRHESTDKEHKETVRQAITSCSGGSGSSFWNQSSETDSRKRKSRDAEESECRSDATELESAPGIKPSQKSGTSRRSRVAEVHNLSERRRRDRINERMRALQELIPHSNKSDKASMLDEAIEYMKSLQLQLQLMWMGSGMAPMMVPGMQHYMSRFGVGIGPPMLPAIQNLMRLSRLPLVDQTVNMAPRMNQAPVNYQNQMQISGYLEPYANYMGFHPMPNTSQAMNMFNIGFHSARQNQSLTPPGNGNGSIG